MELETSWRYVRNLQCFLIYFPYLTSDPNSKYTYLESARLTGSNSANNNEILKKITILEPFYGIRNMCEIVGVFSYISRVWLLIQSANTYLKSARFTGFNSTNNFEILQKLTILESFYGIKNILDTL